MTQKRPSYLEFHGGTYRVSINVPRKLHHVLGTKLRSPSLQTDSRKEAEVKKWDYIAKLKKEILDAERE
ncbi:MAG: DUF6538 domain-containing protein, partial [Pseudomonadota bacterium]